MPIMDMEWAKYDVNGWKEKNLMVNGGIYFFSFFFLPNPIFFEGVQNFFLAEENPNIFIYYFFYVGILFWNGLKEKLGREGPTIL